MSRLIQYLPFYERKSSYFKELMNCKEKQLDDVTTILEDIDKQLSVDTATWALDIYEKELGIPTDIDKPLDHRRSVIKSKWRGSGKMDATVIKLTADAYTNGDVEVSFQDKIHIKMTSYHGIPNNFSDLKTVIRQIIPAHLDVVYEYRYLLNKDIDESMTVGDFSQKPLTHFAPIKGIS